MRLFYSVLFCAAIFLSLGSNDALAIKLRNVIQSGTGSSGSIKIDFNKDYSRSDITVNYFADRAELIIPNAFVVPVKRVFKSSSDKSSVTKIEAANISGRSLKLSIYFRNIPIDVIKKTAKLTGKGNIISFNYLTTLNEAVAEVPKQQPEQEPVKTPAIAQVAQAPITDIKPENKKIAEPAIKVEERSAFVSTLKKYITALTGFFKLAVLIVLLGFGVFILFLVVRKYAGGTIVNKAHNKSFGLSKNKDDSGIKILNNLELEKGKTLYVIEVMGERMLIASGSNYVTMLSRLENDAKTGQGYLFNNQSDSNVDNEQQAAVMRTRLKDKLSGF